MNISKVKKKQSGRKRYPLKVESIGKKFGGISAVDNVSFSIEKGSITGLIGPNGAGKSTTFDLITGVTSPDTGVIKLTSGNVVLDSVLVATTNDKHLDAFKTVPDFNSFKGRFELINVPYLLFPVLEK